MKDDFIETFAHYWQNAFFDGVLLSIRFYVQDASAARRKFNSITLNHKEPLFEPIVIASLHLTQPVEWGTSIKITFFLFSSLFTFKISTLNESVSNEWHYKKDVYQSKKKNMVEKL